MPAITRVKDLYMAKSVGELNNQANDKTTLMLKSYAPNLVINSMEKVFQQAESEFSCGDEEKAYMFYMRAASLYQAVKSPRLKEDKKYGKMFQEAVKKCEGLARNLEKRYSEAFKPNTPSSTTTSLPIPGKTVKAINSKNLSNNSPKSVVSNDHNLNNNGFKDDLSYVNNRRDDCNITQVDGDITTPTIEPTELFELIEDLQKNRPQDVILLLDARRKEDFESSHISNLKTDRAKLLNIPENLLVKGTAATKLMKMLPENAQTILKERRTARKVIIFDWQSTSHNENQHLDALYAALWKFDPKDGCQSPPILLKTGYYGWVASYPTFTSNPKVTPPPSADDSSNVSDYDSASINFYTRLIKSEDSSSDSASSAEKPKTLLNGSSHQSESSDDIRHDVDMGTIQDSNELVARLTNSKFKDNANKIPGSAQPVPTVNRQVKPKLSKNELNVATVSPFNNKINRNDKPNGLTQPPTNHPTNGAIYENNNNIIERELKARRALEAQEEINKLMENDYEKGHREKDEMLKKMEADRENLLRENVDLKRRLKPNPSSFNSLNSSTSSLSTSSSSSTIATGTTMSPVLSREPLKPPVRFNMIGENGDSDEDESENEREMVSKDSDEEMCSPLHRPKLETKPITPKASSKRSDERTVSESSSTLIVTPRPPSSIAKTGKSLPRSYSSPNIADHYDDDDSQNRPPTHHHHPPTFDRALKPLNNGNEGFPRSFTSSTRMRNFSPIYGIPGQVNTGLKNLGNTCFMNAVLQCLADTSIFRRYFLQEKHMTDISRNSRLGSKGELADELGALIREIRSNQYKSVSPSHFKDAVGTHMPFFMGCEQQDAHEFLCMLLEKLHADLNKAPQANVPNGIFTLPDDLPPNIAINKFWTHHLSRNRSIVSDLFEGLLMSTLKCTACGKQSHSFEVFTNLSLPIPTKLGHRFTILDCLDLFSDEEKLAGEAAWECPTCKTKRDAIKQIKICKLPKVLVIHLKRFSYEGKWRQKLQNMVDFPLFDLKLKKYRSCNSLDPVGFDASYDLYGVVNHYGTLEGGHYVAYCKNDEKNKWFKYDDHEVTELSAADVKSHAAYLLFYTSRN